ncbi:MAG: LysM peptidoglycan-binding domain-containing protein [Gammaproteobacteria bacterium]|nr:LysM peptidoglycan-binding domain-containing protein [Gammaproteobacteria bacterium]MBQ0840906.1 LysM peptidoglycan-binding domain-containing protein [Gammaproteobacteria bacterium]
MKSPIKTVALALIGAWVLVATAVAEAPFKDDIPDKHTVVKGDTLWDISAHFLTKPWLWPEIWQVNPQIQNPHLIYPGDVISLIYIDGKPRLVLTRSRDVKLSPQIREISNRQAISTLPLDLINSFLSRNRVVDSGVLEAAPYILSGKSKHLLTGKGDDFYARGDFSAAHEAYGVYRNSGPFTDPKTNEILGIRAQDIGAGSVKAIDDDIATLMATRSIEELRINDRLLELEERKIDANFYPSSPPENSEGLIMSVEGAVSTGGMLDVVSINLGERDGMEIGNMLSIFKTGAVVKDRVQGGSVTLPPEKAGLVMVFRTFEKMSFALILTADQPISVRDIARNP